jgi:hypothetical protein
LHRAHILSCSGGSGGDSVLLLLLLLHLQNLGVVMKGL